MGYFDKVLQKRQQSQYNEHEHLMAAGGMMRPRILLRYMDKSRLLHLMENLAKQTKSGDSNAVGTMRTIIRMIQNTHSKVASHMHLEVTKPGVTHLGEVKAHITSGPKLPSHGSIGSTIRGADKGFTKAVLPADTRVIAHQAEELKGHVRDMVNEPIPDFRHEKHADRLKEFFSGMDPYLASHVLAKAISGEMPEGKRISERSVRNMLQAGSFGERGIGVEHMGPILIDTLNTLGHYDSKNKLDPDELEQHFKKNVSPLMPRTPTMGDGPFSELPQIHQTLIDNRAKGLLRQIHYFRNNALQDKIFKKTLSDGPVSEKEAKEAGEELDVDWGEISLTELTRGMNVELEHRDLTRGDYLKTAKIALAHLKESADYYTKLSVMEQTFKKATFQKNPVEVQAHQVKSKENITTLEGVMTASPGDWVVTGVKGEKYPVKDSIFQETFTPLDGERPHFAPPKKSKDPQVFTMVRNGDESGVSGTGRVADGVLWPSGKVTLTWRGKTPSSTQFDTFAEFVAIHIEPHPTNQTEIKWL